MKPCDVKDMLHNIFEDPSYFVNYHNIGRGLVGKHENSDSKLRGKLFIKETKSVNCWRILGDKLEKVDDYGTLFDTETYIFQWTLKISDENATEEEDTLFYYWKGNNAAKGFSPLPPEIEDENPAMDRICQWSEPAIFFHMFAKTLVIFSGSHMNFNPNMKKLFIVRGELASEIHLYEIPCLKENLRSRGVFLLVNPVDETIYFWCGSAVPNKYQHLVHSSVNLNNRSEYWKHYKIIEVRDGCDDNLFLESLVSQNGSYLKLPHCIESTPRLFYFNSITGDFLATEIQYPLRSSEEIAPFPFLQSHLYTADQPGLFLLDNGNEVWLWEGWKTPESNLDLFETELKLAKETANNYAKEKNLTVKHVHAGLEPLEFINIFPYWSKRSDIAKIQVNK